MKLTIPWTPLLAVFTLSLGTLAEGAAIAASPHSPTPHREAQENLVLAQVFGNRCALLERSTELFLESRERSIMLDPETIVRLLDNASSNGWIRVEDVARPSRTGFIRDSNVGKIEDCGRLVPPVGFPRQQPSVCYRVEAETLAIHRLSREGTETRVILSQGDPVEESPDPFTNRVFEVDGDQTWVRIRYIPAPFERDAFEGWVKLYHFENNRRIGQNLSKTRECN